ncbi:hypothetical protein ELAN_21850 [Elizabethkingia anophelis]|uniref:hypothetical protein n=1 Tax=Elizabethkingia anophelis TaxID=1117645 RepID=UPI0023E902DB|nr:hypothetical protein [Elizabethkingia anophelis]GJN58630.1 hypothetical protein ELAN_21850 [Elizabethkingia anophelis]HDP3250455.1 hypothetical protein [Elizabethkingia anophelis]
MKYLKYLILFSFFIGVIIYYNKRSDIAMKQSAEYLRNNVEFEGYVTGFEQSNNHAFGIIHLKLTKSNISEFNKIIDQGIYPYKIKDGMAELYTSIPEGLQKNDIYIINSNRHKYSFIDKTQKNTYISDLFIITDSFDIDFVKKNTEFK